MNTPTKNIVFVGSSGIGKYRLIETFISGTFPTTRPYKLFSTWKKTAEFEGSPVELNLCYIEGNETYRLLNKYNYPDTDVAVIVFGIDEPRTLKEVFDFWAHEVNHYCPNAPIILVGLRKDLRDNPETLEQLSKLRESPVTEENGKAMAQEIKAFAYLECSSKNFEGVEEVFAKVVEAAFLPKKTIRRKKFCCVQ